MTEIVEQKIISGCKILADDELNIPLFMADQVDRSGWHWKNKRVFILLDFPSYLIYYTCKKVTHE